MFGISKFSLAAVVVLACSACSTVPPDPQTVEVQVKGTVTTVADFDKALQPMLAGYVVGCDGCDKFGTVDTVLYSFYRRETELYTKFGTAWNAVVPQPGETKPGMTFFSKLIAPDCNTRPQCYNLGPCIQFARCSSDANLRSCKACP